MCAIRTYSQVRIACFDAYSKAAISAFVVTIPNESDSVQFETQWGAIDLDLSFLGKEIFIKNEKYLPYSLTVPRNKTIVNVFLIPTVAELSGVVFTDVHRKNTYFNTTVLNIHKISSEKIQALGSNTVKDAIAYEGNIRITRDNALGSSGIEMMGVGGDNVKIMIDGVPIIGRFFNQLDLDQFSVENIEQIEIVKGPMSIIYGSNALAGSINIVSKQGQKNFASIATNYLSEGLYNVSGTTFLKKGKHGLSLSGGRLLFDGWRIDPNQRAFDWIPKEQYNANAVYSYRTNKATIRFKSEWMQAYLNTWGTPMRPYGETAIDLDFLNTRIDNNLTYERNVKKGNIQMIAGNNHFIRSKNTFLKNRVTGERIMVPIPQEQDTQVFNASLLRVVYGQTFRKIETVFGFDGNYETGQGERILNEQQSQFDAALFVSAEKKLWDRLQARGGIRYGYNSAFSAPLLYSLQVKMDMKNNQVIKAAYGRGFRAPSLKELYLNFVDNNHAVVGNADLKAEFSHSLTASYKRYYGKNKWKMSTTVEGFYNDIRNKIDFVYFSATEAEYGNIARFQSVGGEFIQNVSYDQWSLNATYVHLWVSNALEDGQSNFLQTPQLVLQPAWIHEKSKTAVQLFCNYYGKMNRAFLDGSDGIRIGVMQSYTLLDATISRPFFKEKLRATIGIRNILNWMDIQNTLGGGGHGSAGGMIISPGRTFFVNLRYEIFKK